MCGARRLRATGFVDVKYVVAVMPKPTNYVPVKVHRNMANVKNKHIPCAAGSVCGVRASRAERTMNWQVRPVLLQPLTRNDATEPKSVVLLGSGHLDRAMAA